MFKTVYDVRDSSNLTGLLLVRGNLTFLACLAPSLEVQMSGEVGNIFPACRGDTGFL